MILSHKHRFIFIKTTKTGGTSIEVDLNKILGDLDIATPIFPVVEGHKPQNFERGFLKKNFYNHMSASEVRKVVGKDIFHSYFVFCIEREPVDKCISHYSMLRNSPHHNGNYRNLTFDQYVEKKIFPIDTYKYLDDNRNLLVNRILKYEYLRDEIEEVAELLGFKMNFIAKAKTGFREDIKVSAAQRDIIYQAFSESLAFTQYKA